MSLFAFPGVKDRDTKADLERYAQTVEARLPWSNAQFVDVTFTGAGVDASIIHTLNPIDPESVRWIVVSTSAASVPYKDPSVTRRTWQRNVIYLRASAAATMRLLLFVEAL